MLRGVLDRLREWIAVDDPEERIQGSGDVILDPAYNGRYEAERELEHFARVNEPEPSTTPDEEPES